MRVNSHIQGSKDDSITSGLGLLSLELGLRSAEEVRKTTAFVLSLHDLQSSVWVSWFAQTKTFKFNQGVFAPFPARGPGFVTPRFFNAVLAVRRDVRKSCLGQGPWQRGQEETAYVGQPSLVSSSNQHRDGRQTPRDLCSASPTTPPRITLMLSTPPAAHEKDQATTHPVKTI